MSVQPSSQEIPSRPPEELGSTGRFMAQVMRELRALAAHHLQGERRNHTLQPTELVHEAYLRLADVEDGRWKGRTHFFAVAASAVRQVLVDHARAHRAQKRGMGKRWVELQDDDAMTPDNTVDILALDEALQALGRMDARQHQVVEMRFFGGLTVEEIAGVLSVSPRTVKNLWRAARAWLIHSMREPEPR